MGEPNDTKNFYNIIVEPKSGLPGGDHLGEYIPFQVETGK
jgi:hypothetical protein